eukprot:PITA_22770
MNKSQDVEAWLLGMRKFIRFHDYSENMKARIALFSLRGKAAKEFYELRIGSTTDEEYTSRFLELLRYVPYLREEKAKFHRFISGFPIGYRDHIEFDEPISLEEAIRKLKYCYEQSKRKSKPKHDLKRNDKGKGKWPPKRGRREDASEKDNIVPYKRFNATDKGHEEQHARGGGKEPLQCLICGKDHRKRDFPQY